MSNHSSSNFLLTIITPVLNDYDGLVLCTNSVGISNGEFEHIIIDGNSTDGSYEYAEKLSERPHTKVLKQTSKYIYGAFNDALRVASGKNVIFLHCGDEINIETVMKLIKSYNDFDLIAGSCSQNSVNGIKYYYRSKRNKLSSNSMSILHPALIIRRDKYNQVGGFDEVFKISADVDCIFKILKISNNIHYVDDLVTHMEEFGNSQMHYFKKLREHTIIKYRHGGLILAFNHIPKRLILDFIIIPIWVRVKSLYKKINKKVR